MKNGIAVVRLDVETGKILDVSLVKRNLRFRCKRCAIYCCKLGGPCLTNEDIEQIEAVGHKRVEFVEASSREYGRHSLMTNAMKNKEDGSCIFLNTDEKRSAYECSIYENRPILCRLFPFEIERIDVDSFRLKLLLCNGLNDINGKLLNERFIAKDLREIRHEHLLKFIELIRL